MNQESVVSYQYPTCDVQPTSRPIPSTGIYPLRYYQIDVCRPCEMDTAFRSHYVSVRLKLCRRWAVRTQPCKQPNIKPAEDFS